MISSAVTYVQNEERRQPVSQRVESSMCKALEIVGDKIVSNGLVMMNESVICSNGTYLHYLEIFQFQDLLCACIHFFESLDSSPFVLRRRRCIGPIGIILFLS